MTKYRVFTKEVLAENLDENQLHEILAMYADKKIVVEFESYDPDAKRLGRDPDLH
jgi:hypothetical protein|tara:strand:+ start:594 stop:758 length:165 start_codon:yes stop_codon:yes gene_type:complete